MPYLQPAMAHKFAKLLFVFAIALFYCLNTSGQVSTVKEIDKLLTGIYEGMDTADMETRFKIVAPCFKKELLKQLKNPLTLQNDLPKLSERISISTSPDGLVKFYGWNDGTGGTWFSILTVAQFIGANSKIVVQQITSGPDSLYSDPVDFTDAAVYKVYEVNINSVKHYLTFASGVHGGGQVHKIVQIFKRTGNHLEKCPNCFPERDLVIQYSRGDDSNLEYNPVTCELSYAEFIFNDAEGFYEPGNKTVKWKLINGAFVKQ